MLDPEDPWPKGYQLSDTSFEVGAMVTPAFGPFSGAFDPAYNFFSGRTKISGFRVGFKYMFARVKNAWTAGRACFDPNCSNILLLIEFSDVIHHEGPMTLGLTLRFGKFCKG